MKRYFASAFGAFGLVLALTGCVPLGTAAPEPAPTGSSTVAVPVPEPTHEAPEIQPYSTDGMTDRVKGLAKSSFARQIQSGRHPIEGAIPGTERILLAETFSGEYHAALPKAIKGNMISASFACQKETKFTVDFIDAKNNHSVGSGSTSCNSHGGSGIGFDFLPNGTPTYMKVVPGGEEPIEVSVVSFNAPKP